MNKVMEMTQTSYDKKAWRRDSCYASYGRGDGVCSLHIFMAMKTAHISECLKNSAIQRKQARGGVKAFQGVAAARDTLRYEDGSSPIC